MKPFNLEQARQGKLVQTRSGQQVQNRQICSKEKQ